MEKKEVRILLVGEDGVGKTSLILSLISEEFPESTPARADEILIPADVTPEKVPARIVDFSTRSKEFVELSKISGAQLQNTEEMYEELRRADVICVVYAVDNQESINKITSYWIPIIHEVLGNTHSKPVILVGNKCDSGDGNSRLEDQILPIMNQYSEIETCVECSAKSMKNISELFFYAQKAVLHPWGPLYVAEERELTASAKKALVRIFKICDQDNDGLLNDFELNNFQIRCFGVPLLPESLNDVKGVVMKSIGDGVLDNALTLKGKLLTNLQNCSCKSYRFLYLHTLFLQRGRHETTWTVLRKFGYDNSLQLAKNYLYPPLTVPKGCTTELSFDGCQFITAVFEKYDEDKDGCLSPAELQNLFSVCPVLPWGPDVHNTVCTNEQGWITYDGFIAYWMLTTVLDLPRCLENLAYLGFNTSDRNQTAAINITRDKRLDWQAKDTRRTVFQCHVIGPKDVGKSAFLQCFLGRNLTQQAVINKRQLSSYTINTTVVNDHTKYLLLHEIDVLTPEEALTSYELSCDVVCLMYDVSNPHSFEYCAKMYKKYFHRTRVPCLVVATKCDRREVLQQYEYQPIEFCQRFKLGPPVKFNIADGDHSDVYTKLATLANFPHIKHIYHLYDSSTWIKLSLGAAAATLVGFLIYRNI